MSIIYDALQKTQKNREMQNPLPTQKPPQRKIPVRKVAMLIAIILSIIAVLIIYPLLAKLWTPKKGIVSATKATNAINNKLVLSGVFVSDDYKMAMINNHAYQVGDTVNGMKIVSIEYEGVRLQDGNTIFMLR